ncbi:MAG: glutamate--cysteine ligase, partial [Halobacteria archaeon]|nr:glutamate--cysteine ligase [Halobacteria archaeon]
DDPPPELEDNLGTELFKFVVETRTEKASTLDETYDEIAAKRESLVEHARSHGYEVLAAGLHPSARWDEHDHIDKPRYTKQLRRIGYPQWRNITAGLHVHVGMDDPDKAVWVADEVRRYLPLFLALSANSPFWYGRDTGLRSARAVVFENLPNTGMPTAFGSWEEFSRFESRMVEEGSIVDRGEIWWDVRPNSEYGTVEIRAPDSQTDLERSYGFAVLARSLVLELSRRYEEGASATDVRRELLDENKWRALRHGHDATFLRVDRSSGTVGVEEMLYETLDEVEIRSSDRDYVESLLSESGTRRQIEAYNQGGMEEVLESVRVSPP